MYLIEPLRISYIENLFNFNCDIKILKSNIYVALMSHSQNEIINILRLSANYGN